MKAIKYLAIIALAAGLSACQKETDEPVPVAGDKVEVTFDVQFPEAIPVETKAQMGENPLGTEDFDIYLCLYGAGDGYVQNWIPATETTKTVVDGYVTGGTYRAFLPLSDEARTLHVIANPPASLIDTPPTSLYMDDVMHLMVDTNNECSYWQEVTLPHIRFGSDGVTVDPTSVAPITSGIHLVRNYTKIIVDRTTRATAGDSYKPRTDNFDVLQWTLINVPDRGYVAPYTGNETNRFPAGYLNIKDYTAEDALYTRLTATDQYAGNIPDGAVIIDTYPDVEAENNGYVAGGVAKYMYERPLPTLEQKQTAILAQIRFNGDNGPGQPGHDLGPKPHEAEQGIEKIYWYKIELLNESGVYMPFLRDIVYTIRLKGITEVGYASAEAAYNGRYFGNISSSLETAGLSELSNGQSAIHVDVMDYTFLTGDATLLLDNGSDPETPARFWFSPNGNPNNIYYQSHQGGGPDHECTITVDLLSVEGFAPAVSSFVADEYGQIQVTLNQTSAAIKKSIIRVSGKKGRPNGPDPVLYRDITVTLMQTQDFKHGAVATAITTQPDDLTAANESVGIKIQLPEGLGASVFPVQVRIEAENNTLSATSTDLPAQTGASVFDATRNTFYFIYTITYDMYRHLDQATWTYNYTYEFPITLYTNSRTDNSTLIDIRDLAGKFNPMKLGLGVEVPVEPEP
ncbi:MAG: hypothetical protein K6F98_04570 [Bacteroidales bacterium]|nr:hypothetical protein [Bacteroidales bacterium]